MDASPVGVRLTSVNHCICTLSNLLVFGPCQELSVNSGSRLIAKRKSAPSPLSVGIRSLYGVHNGVAVTVAILAAVVFTNNAAIYTQSCTEYFLSAMSTSSDSVRPGVGREVKDEGSSAAQPHACATASINRRYEHSRSRGYLYRALAVWMRFMEIHSDSGDSPLPVDAARRFGSFETFLRWGALIFT